MNRSRCRTCVAAVSSIALVLMAGCHVDMWRQPKILPQQDNAFFGDRSGSRHAPPHTVARGEMREDRAFFTGAAGGQLMTKAPLPVTRDNIHRGRDLFDIHCAPCHGPLGYGNGMIAQRGLALRRKPGDYHTDRLRAMPIGYFYEVMTNGAGVMYSAAGRVRPADRWRIAMYVRVLQLSQYARPEDAPSGALEPVQAARNAGAGGGR